MCWNSWGHGKMVCWVVKYVLELVMPCGNGVLGGEANVFTLCARKTGVFALCACKTGVFPTLKSLIAARCER